MISTIIYCIIGALGLLPLAILTEMDSSIDGDAGCLLVAIGLFLLTVSGIGLYYCGTLGVVLSAVL